MVTFQVLEVGNRLLAGTQGVGMKLKCEDCGWTGDMKLCLRKYEGVPLSYEVELQLVCPNCHGYDLGEEVLIPV